MAVIPYGVRVYSEVVIDLRNLPPVSGRVAWCKRDRVGIAFDEKIDLDVFFGRRVSQQATGFLQKLKAGRSEITAEPFIRRSEERRVGRESVSKCGSGGA